MNYVLKYFNNSILTILFAALATTHLFEASARGSLVTINVEGVVDVIEGPLGSTFSVGNTFVGTFTYDTLTPDVETASSLTGRYEGAMVSASFQVLDGATVIYDAGAAVPAAVPDPDSIQNVIGVFDEFPVPSEGFSATDQVRVAVATPDQWPSAPLFNDPDPLAPDLLLIRVFFALLNDNVAHDIHNSDALSEISWILDDYPDEQGFFFSFKDPSTIGVTPLSEDIAVFGHLTSIPEPSTISFLAIGLLGFLRREHVVVSRST